MKIRIGEAIQILIVVAFFVVAYHFLPLLPERIASHWDINGNVNGWMPKNVGLFVLPFLSVFTLIIFMVSARLEMNGKSIAPFRGAYEFFCVVVLLFLLYVYGLTIVWSMGRKFDMSQMLAPGFSAIMFSIAVLMEKSSPNYFIGIRTKALIENPEKWSEVHKSGAGYFKIAAVIGLFGMIFPKYMFILSVGPLIVISIIIAISAGSMKSNP